MSDSELFCTRGGGPRFLALRILVKQAFIDVKICSTIAIWNAKDATVECTLNIIRLLYINVLGDGMRSDVQ